MQNVFIAFRVSEKLNLIRKYLAWPPKVSNFFCSSKEHKIHWTTMPCVMLYNFSLLFIRNTMMYHSDIWISTTYVYSTYNWETFSIDIYFWLSIRIQKFLTQIYDMTFIIWVDPLIVNRQQIYHYLPPLSQFKSRHRCANGNINNVLLFEGGGTFFKIWSVNCYYTSFITSNVCSFINI